MLRCIVIALSLAFAATVSAVEPREFADLARRADAVRPKAADFRWQEIPWQTEPAEALAAAQAENRPLFVWLAGGRDRDGSPLERC